MTEFSEGDFNVRLLDELLEVKESNDSLSHHASEATCFFFIFLLFAFLFLFFFLLLFFLLYLAHCLEVVDSAFSVSVEVISPLYNDWLRRLDGVFTLSVCVLEEVHIGRQSKELSPAPYVLSHLLEVAEVVDCNCALGRHTI